MFAINQVSFNRDELLTKKKRICIKHFKRVEVSNRATFIKINWEKCMTISTLILTVLDQEIISALFETLPLEPEKKLQVLKI